MRALVVLVLFAMGLLSLASEGAAQSRFRSDEGGFWTQTTLRALSFDGMNSGIVRQAARESFELSGGGAVDLVRWYSPKFPHLSASFETNIGRDMFLIWGGSLGEEGEKYRLGPSGTIGFAMRQKLGKHATLNLEILGQFGGALHENQCIGNFGEIGGVQAVNCRLAATPLSPKQTLQYLWNEPATALAVLRITYQFRF